MTSFVKMHGLGNDFVVVDGPIHPEPGWVAAVCDRHRGVGADGMLAVTGDGTAVVMGYWNADGSRAEMCGNGLRCVARYAADRGLVEGTEFWVETPAGRRMVSIARDGEITVELGAVTITGMATVEDREFVTVSVGNPHAVTFVEDPDAVSVTEVGPRVEHDPAFPNGTNVEFVTMETPERIRLRVWERGVGETLACGSGMAAAAAAARQRGARDAIEVAVPGGVGSVRFDGDRAWLTGPAVYVFEGTLTDVD